MSIYFYDVLISLFHFRQCGGLSTLMLLISAMKKQHALSWENVHETAATFCIVQTPCWTHDKAAHIGEC